MDFSPLAWGELSRHIAKSRVNVWFVECDPKLTKVAQRLDHAPGKSLKQRSRVCAKECSFLFKPAWVRKVMEADRRLNTSSMQVLQHLAIALQCAFGKTVFLWLDAAPFHRKPQRIDS